MMQQPVPLQGVFTGNLWAFACAAVIIGIFTFVEAVFHILPYHIQWYC